MWLARVRFLFRGNTCRRHFQSPIFCIRDDLWSVVGRLFGADAKRPIFPAGRFCGGNRGRAAQLRRIMVNSAKTELSFAKEVSDALAIS